MVHKTQVAAMSIYVHALFLELNFCTGVGHRRYRADRADDSCAPIPSLGSLGLA